MAALAVVAPLTQYFDLAGNPLDNGKLYFGAVGLNPETNPITVYWDAAATQPAAQPIRTHNGYAVRNGKIATVYSETDYSLTVRDKRNRLVLYAENSVNFGGAQSVLVQLLAFIAALLSSIGASLIGFIQDGTGAIYRTVQSKLRDQVSVLDFGADPTGTTGSADALRAAIALGKTVYVPPGTYLVDKSLTLLAGQAIVGASQGLSTLKLAYNGDMFPGMLSHTRIEALWLHGNGANFTGRGVVWAGNTTPKGYISDCKITHFTGPCVEFAVDGAGSQTTIINCEIYCQNQANPGIKLPNPEAYGPARRFLNIQCSGGILADVGASDNSMFVACQANGITFATPGVGSSTWAKKTILNACRFSTVGVTTTVYGEDHTIIGCAFAGSLVLGTGTKNSKAVGNSVAGGYSITDSSGSLYNGPPNYIDHYAPLTPIAVTWGAAGVAPSIGNGSIDARYTQDSNRATVNITLIAGSTTSFGTGSMSFTLPFSSSPASAATNVGVGRLTCAGLFYPCVVVNTAGTNVLTLYTHGAANAVSNAIPGAWTNGNNMFLQIDLPTA